MFCTLRGEEERSAFAAPGDAVRAVVVHARAGSATTAVLDETHVVSDCDTADLVDSSVVADIDCSLGCGAD